MAVKIVSFLNRRLAILIAGIVIAGIAFQVLPISVSRVGAALALVVLVFQERRASDSPFLTSPLFFLGAIPLIFFSLILGVMLAVMDTSTLSSHILIVDTYFGSDAERVILVFALTCLAAHSLIAGGAIQNPSSAHARLAWSGKNIYIFAGLAVVLSVVNILNYMSLKVGGPHVVEIRSLAPPLLAFCLTYLVYQAVEATGRNKMLIAMVIVISIAGLFFIQEGKKPFFMFVAGALYWFRLKQYSAKRLIILGLATVLTALVLLQIMQMIRYPGISMITTDGRGPVLMFKNVFLGKVVLRQTETRICLNNVIDEHGQQPFLATRQLFWLKGLTPRVLWQEKPNLSLGREYALHYCKTGVASQHTASITVLGQPVIFGGGVGLVLHGGILIACLGGLVWLARDPRCLSTVTVVAMLPWLIDFDQDFSLYVANATKFFLVMTPLIIFTRLLAENGTRVTPMNLTGKNHVEGSPDN